MKHIFHYSPEKGRIFWQGVTVGCIIGMGAALFALLD